MSTWLVLGLLGAVAEAWAVRGGNHKHTLSHTVRRTSRTNTLGGRVAFSAAWLGFAGWFWAHVVLSPHNKRAGS